LKKTNGFTLIELLIALSIVAILAITAITLYSSHVRKARRTDAINTLTAMALAEERYRTTNTQYGTLAQVWSGTTSSPEGYYTLSITALSATAYTLSAQAVGDQTNDSQDGTSCSTIQLTANNSAITKTPTGCWPK
jgi:type IV pilus assembly protein PilE